MMQLNTTPCTPVPFSLFKNDAQLRTALAIRLGKPKQQRAVDWALDFGPLQGSANTRRTITVQPTCRFRGEKILATDDAVPNGSGTRIINIFVGNKNQLNSSSKGILTTFFGSNNLGSGLKLTTCMPGLTMTMEVEFIKSCTFSATIFGKAAP